MSTDADSQSHGPSHVVKTFSRIAGAYVVVAAVVICLFVFPGLWWWGIPWAVFVAIACVRSWWRLATMVKLWAVQTFVIIVASMSPTLELWWVTLYGGILYSAICFMVWVGPPALFVRVMVKRELGQHAVMRAASQSPATGGGPDADPSSTTLGE